LVVAGKPEINSSLVRRVEFGIPPPNVKLARWISSCNFAEAAFLNGSSSAGLGGLPAARLSSLATTLARPSGSASPALCITANTPSSFASNSATGGPLLRAGSASRPFWKGSGVGSWRGGYCRLPQTSNRTTPARGRIRLGSLQTPKRKALPTCTQSQTNPPLHIAI